MSHPLLHLRDGPVAHLRLNRPDVHNAFDAMLIAGPDRRAGGGRCRPHGPGGDY